MIAKENAAEQLFDLRCKYGKTQEQTAIGSKVSRITINRIETGKIDADDLRANTFFKLNEFFKKLGEKVKDD